jgi:ribosomal protein S18 acetylase RimI-like enzyme
VAVRVIFVHDRQLDEKLAGMGWQTEQMKLMNLVMGTVTKKADIYGHYGISEFVNFYTACVDPKCRGQGLASYMYELAFKFLRSFPAFKVRNEINIWTYYFQKYSINFTSMHNFYDLF